MEVSYVVRFKPDARHGLESGKGYGDTLFFLLMKMYHLFFACVTDFST